MPVVVVVHELGVDFVVVERVIMVLEMVEMVVEKYGPHALSQTHRLFTITRY